MTWYNVFAMLWDTMLRYELTFYDNDIVSVAKYMLELTVLLNFTCN